MLPFTADQFFDLFVTYNRAIWPAQIFAYGLAAIAIAAILVRSAAGSRIAFSVLGLLWLWNGFAYHLTYFTRINTAAYVFAALFVLQGILLSTFAATAAKSAPSTWQGPWAPVGLALIAYATVFYGLLGSALGHGWPRAPVFGVAPCPTVIFTIGIAMVSTPILPGWLLAIPLLWAAIGSTAAILLSVEEDLGLLAAAVIGAGWLISRYRAAEGA